MGGWKTWVGVMGLVAGGVMSVIGYTDAATIAYEVAIPMVVLGLGHKLDKVQSILKSVGGASAEISKKLDEAKPQ